MAKRRFRGWAGVAVAALAAVSLATVARVAGASWLHMIWGGLAFLACSMLAEFVAWLATGGPLRLERRPPQDAERHADRTG